MLKLALNKHEQIYISQHLQSHILARIMMHLKEKPKFIAYIFLQAWGHYECPYLDLRWSLKDKKKIKLKALHNSLDRVQ